MATREKRLAQFDGSGDPPPDQPVEVLCEDHSGTYQLPFACRWIDGHWRNDRTGGMVEATVVAWRLPRRTIRKCRRQGLTRCQLCQNATKSRVILTFGTPVERTAPESLIDGRTPLFTARCRPEPQATPHIQDGDEGP